MIFVHTLGTAQIDVGETRVKPGASRRFAMLLYLASEPGRRVPRTTLHELICPDQTEKNAQHSVREFLYQLRLAGVPIRSDVHGLELAAEAVHSDYGELLGMERPEASHLKAVEGGFLPGYAPTHSEAYAEWLESFRSKRVFELCRAILREVARAKAGGDWAKTELAARACLALDPLNEEATLALAEMLAIGGAKVQAVKLLDGYIAEVGDEKTNLRVPATILRRRIKEQDPLTYSASTELPFVGRGEEMTRLADALEAARAGKTQLVVVAGEAGIGKTRLAEEFGRIAEIEGVAVQRFTARPHDVRRPMGAFMDLVPSLLRMPGALGCSPKSLTILSRLTSHGDESPVNAIIDAQAVSYFIGRAIEDLLDAITHEMAVLLVIEDAQWLDEHSLATLIELSRKDRSHGVVLLVSSRDRRVMERAGSTTDGVAVIALQPLGAHESDRLSALALPSERPDAAMQRWVRETAGGNPLFIKTLSAHYVATGKQFEVPATLLELIAQRTRCVGPRALAALSACVALGKWCSFGRFAAVLQLPHAELIMAVNELHSAGLIKTTSDGLAPAHPLIAESVQAASAHAALRLTHQQVAKVLEIDPDFSASPSMLWDCSEHWLAAGDRVHAVELLRICASHAREIGRPSEAARTLQHAASLATDKAVQRECLCDAILAGRIGGEFDVVLECAHALRTIQPAFSHDDVELSELEALAAVYSDGSVFTGRALRCLDESDATTDHRVRAALTILKYADVWAQPTLADRVRSAIGPAELASVDENLRLEYELVFASTFAQFARAADCARIINAHSFENASRMRHTALAYNAGIALWIAGQTIESVEMLERVYHLARDAGAARLSMLAALQLSGALFDIGSRQASHDWLAVAESVAAESARPAWPFEMTLLRIDMALADGDAERAKTLLDEADSEGEFGNVRRENWKRTFQLRLRQMGFGRRLTDKEIAIALESARSRNFLTGLRDLEIAVVLFHVAETNPVRAREIALRYVASERRTLAPLGVVLRQALAAIEADYLLDGNMPRFRLDEPCGFPVGPSQ